MLSKHQKQEVRMRLFMLLALVGIMALTLAPRTMQAQTVPCAQEIVMREGLTLASIAALNFGTQDGVAELIAATNAQAAVDSSYTVIRDPNQVEIGWKICVPSVPNDDAVANATRASSVEAASASSRSTDSRRAIGTTGVALEENDQLLQAMIAARSSAGGAYPLSIEYLRQQQYPGSPLILEETLPNGVNYRQYLISYQSEGLTLYAAMTVPMGEKPATGWPVVIFNHGYIDPKIYSPIERYTEYVDAIARDGYIILRPDLRGHANSEGEARGAYGDPGYTIDVLNALASIQQYPDADPNRIGMWGHSMGGYLVARAMVVSNEIKAGVIWAGVVAPYAEMVEQWDEGKRSVTSTIAEGELPLPSVLIREYGEPSENPAFWNAISANAFVSNLSGPVQLHHGTADRDVPVSFSDRYYADLIAAGQMVEYYVYPGDDHNISAGFEVAMRRSLEFLDAHVKNPAPMLTQLQASSPAQLAP
jgi:uncharacterized protein